MNAVTFHDLAYPHHKDFALELKAQSTEELRSIVSACLAPQPNAHTENQYVTEAFPRILPIDLAQLALLELAKRAI